VTVLKMSQSGPQRLTRNQIPLQTVRQPQTYSLFANRVDYECIPWGFSLQKLDPADRRARSRTADRRRGTRSTRVGPGKQEARTGQIMAAVSACAQARLLDFARHC